MTTLNQKQQGKQQNATQVMVGLFMPDKGYGLPFRSGSLTEPAKAEPEMPVTAPVLTKLVYTPRDLESILGLSKNTINALLNSGRLRAVRCGRKWLIPRDAVLRFLNQEEQL